MAEDDVGAGVEYRNARTQENRGTKKRVIYSRSEIALSF